VKPTRLVLIACAGAALAVPPAANAQALAPADSAGSDSLTVRKPPRVYYGGGIGFSISSRYTTISLQPHVGYKLTPKTSIGASLRY
jgi:hypothetical protein